MHRPLEHPQSCRSFRDRSLCFALLLSDKNSSATPFLISWRKQFSNSKRKLYKIVYLLIFTILSYIYFLIENGSGFVPTALQLSSTAALANSDESLFRASSANPNLSHRCIEWIHQVALISPGLVISSSPFFSSTALSSLLQPIIPFSQP